MKPFFLNGTLNAYPTSVGTATHTENYRIVINLIIPKFAQNNPRGKLLCIIKEFDYGIIKDILKSAYEKHQIFNCVVLSIKEEQTNTIITMCAYNPFFDNGFLFCRNITQSNYDGSIKEINLFNLQRVNNLQGYPLKV